jgi:hypothetical protein
LAIMSRAALVQANPPGPAPGGLFVPSTLELTGQPVWITCHWRSQAQPFSVVFRSLRAEQIRLIYGDEFVVREGAIFRPNQLIYLDIRDGELGVSGVHPKFSLFFTRDRPRAMRRNERTGRRAA